MKDGTHKLGCAETLRISVNEIVAEDNVLPVGYNDTVPGRYANMPLNLAEDWWNLVRDIAM